MTTAVRSAKKGEASVLENLMQYYLHDLSEFAPIEPDAEGHYRYPYLDHFWEDGRRYPFLIREDNVLAGFALIQRDVDPATGEGGMNLLEFFVLRRFRHGGVGRNAAFSLFDLFPGNWELRVMAANKIALPFWRDSLAVYTGNRFQESGANEVSSSFRQFRFRSRVDSDFPDAIDADTVDY